MANRLDDFCSYLAAKGLAGSTSPGQLALEFVGYFSLSTYPSLLELHRVLEEAGVRELRAQPLPALRGFHCSQEGGDPTILYEQDQWTGAQEHTVLHETYEILLEKLEKTGQGYKAPNGPALCREADRFAAAVLMQEGIFRSYLLDSGFDLVGTRQQFRRSYSSVIYRAKELLGKEMDFLIALYERTTPGPPDRWPRNAAPEEFTVGHWVCTRGIRLTGPRRVFRPFKYPRHVMPIRGGRVLPGSAAEHVVRTGRSLMIERISGFDFWGYNDLMALARPVRWYGRLAKVVLLVLRHGSRDLLEPQVVMVDPDIRPRSYQLI